MPDSARRCSRIVRAVYTHSNLNAHAERFERTIKESCLERMILFGEESSRTALRNFVAHHHTERNHQGLGNRLSLPQAGLVGPRDQSSDADAWIPY